MAVTINGSLLAMTTMPNSSTPTDLPDVEYIYVSVTVFYALVFLLGIIGNSLVIYVVCCHRGMSTPTNMFLLNLTSADLLIILVCMPSSLAELHAKDVWLLGSFLCKLVPFLENAMSNTSILIILAISFERYHAICSPFEVLYACSKKRSLKIISCLWLAGTLSALPMVFLSYTEKADHVHWGEVEVCRTPIFGVWRIAYVLGMIAIFFLIPGIILVVLYSSLCLKMIRTNHPWSTHKRRNPTGDTFNGLKINRATALGSGIPPMNSRSSQQPGSRMRSYQFQVVVMLVVIIIMFFICLLPIKIMILVGIFTSVQRMQQLGLEAYLNLMSFARIMFYINSALNPVLYNIVSTKFRHAFTRAFACKFRTGELMGSSVHNGHHLSHRGHYTPYCRRSMGSRTWYSEFELYHTRSDGSGRYLSRMWDRKMNSNDL